MAQKAGTPPLVTLANDDGVPYGSGSPVPVSSTTGAPAATGALADRSGTITTGGTAQNAVASNASRKYLLIRNPVDATEVLHVNLTGTATSASPSIRLDAGDTLVFEGSFVPTNAVSVIAATTGHAFTIWEG